MFTHLPKPLSDKLILSACMQNKWTAVFTDTKDIEYSAQRAD